MDTIRVVGYGGNRLSVKAIEKVHKLNDRAFKEDFNLAMSRGHLADKCGYTVTRCDKVGCAYNIPLSYAISEGGGNVGQIHVCNNPNRQNLMRGGRLVVEESLYSGVENKMTFCDAVKH